MFVHLYFRTQLYGFQVLTEICVPGLNVTKSMGVLDPQWWIRSRKWEWGATE